MAIEASAWQSDVLFVHTSKSVCCVCLTEEPHPHDSLLHCNVCDLTVHPTCYNQPDDLITLSQSRQWNCERCSSQSRVKPVCVFCNESRLEMPFMRTTDNRWAHISCAQCINEAFFTIGKNEVDVSHVKWAPRTQVCLICEKKRGVCIQCAWPKCAKYHHLSCARRDGMYSFLNHHTFNVNTFCAAHSAEKRRKQMRRKQQTPTAVSAAAQGKDKDVVSPSAPKRSRLADSSAGLQHSSHVAPVSSTAAVVTAVAAAVNHSMPSDGGASQSSARKRQDAVYSTPWRHRDVAAVAALNASVAAATQCASIVAATLTATTPRAQQVRQPLACNQECTSDASTPTMIACTPSVAHRLAAEPSFRFATLLPTSVVSALRQHRPRELAVLTSAYDELQRQRYGRDVVVMSAQTPASPRSHASASSELRPIPPSASSSSSALPAEAVKTACAFSSSPHDDAYAVAPNCVDAVTSSPSRAAAKAAFLFAPIMASHDAIASSVKASSPLSPLQLRPRASLTVHVDAAAIASDDHCDENEQDDLCVDQEVADDECAIGIRAAQGGDVRSSGTSWHQRRQSAARTTASVAAPLFVSAEHAVWFAAHELGADRQPAQRARRPRESRELAALGVLQASDSDSEQEDEATGAYNKAADSQNGAARAGPTTFTLPLVQRISDGARASLDLPRVSHGPLVQPGSAECADLCALSVCLAQSQQRVLHTYGPAVTGAASHTPQWCPPSTPLERQLLAGDMAMVAALHRQMHVLQAMLT